MTRQRSYSTQQSTVCPITTPDYLLQMKWVMLAGNKACYKPPSVGIGYVNVSPCSPPSCTITQRKQKLHRTMSADWLAGWKWYPASPLLLWILLAAIPLCFFRVILMYWDIDIFLFKPHLSWTCALQKLFWGKKNSFACLKVFTWLTWSSAVFTECSRSLCWLTVPAACSHSS